MNRVAVALNRVAAALNPEDSMSYRRLLSILQPKTPRRARVWLFLLMACGATWSASVAGEPVTPPHEPAPSFASPLTDEAGAEFDIADFEGRPLMINFWATWCAPCIAELPALSRAAEALAGDGVTVLLVSIDRGGAKKATPFLEKHGVTGALRGFDPKARLSREMGVRGLPTTILLSAGQDSAWRFVGPFEWDDQAMLTLVRGLLAE